MPFNTVLSLEWRISRDGMVSVNGNYFSVPDRARRRVVEVHTLADEVRIYQDRRLLAVHPVLDGRGQRHIAAGHRRWSPPGQNGERRQGSQGMTLAAPGQAAARRDFCVYDRIGRALASGGRA